MSISSHFWTLPSDQAVKGNYISRFWKDSQPKKDIIDPYPILLPGVYVLGMATYAITVVYRVAKVARAFFSFVNFLKPTRTGPFDLELALMKLYSSLVGVVCPPIAYRIDEWCDGIVPGQGLPQEDSLSPPSDPSHHLDGVNPSSSSAPPLSPPVGIIHHKVKVVWSRESQLQSSDSSRSQIVEVVEVQLSACGWSFKEGQGSKRNPHSKFWKSPATSKWTVISSYITGMVGYSFSLVKRIGALGVQVIRNIRLTPPNDGKLTAALVDVATAFLGCLFPPVAYRVDEFFENYFKALRKDLEANNNAS